MNAIVLNKDQQKGVDFIKQWWVSTKTFAVIHGKAGYGKTAMTFQAIAALPGKVNPIVTAPTNAATFQLAKVAGKVIRDTPIKTIYSALGFSFNSNQEKQVLKREVVPPDLIKANLLVIDEASFIGDKKALKDRDNLRLSIFDAVKNSGVTKILFIGHKSQLPEVQEGDELKYDDKCESVVFNQSYPQYDLTIPMRARGELQQAHDYLETLIYEPRPMLRNNWRIYKSEFDANLISLEWQKEFIHGDRVVLAYTNKQVDSLNAKVRTSLFSETNHVNVGDKIIFTKPVVSLGSIPNYFKEKKIISMKGEIICNNSRATVIEIKLKSILGLTCYELLVNVEGANEYVYLPKDLEEFEKFKRSYQIKAFASNTIAAKEKAWRTYHAITRIFAEFKFAYAMTVHRSQGMSVPNVVVDWDDIQKCTNRILRHKLLYVAGSRSSNSLFIKG